MSENPLPKTLTRLEVMLGGEALAEADARTLVSCRVSERIGEPGQCELVLLGPNGPLGRDGPTPGCAIEVRAGEGVLFRGDLTGVRWRRGPAGQRELRLRGYDVLHRLRKRRACRMHVHTTTADLARELVLADGIDVRSVAVGPVWPRLLQLGESDLELLQAVTAAAGLGFALLGDELVLMTAAGDTGREPVTLRLGEELLEAAVDLNGDPACRSVTAFGWDVLRATAHTARADVPRSGREVAAAFPPDALGVDGAQLLGNTTAVHEEQVLARAQRALDDEFGREVVCEGIAIGDGALRPGTTVMIEGVDRAIDGRHVLTGAIHRITPDEGWLVELTTAPPPPAGRRPPVLTLGRVQAVDDPEGLGRVQVALSAFDDVESDWMPVLAPAAGAGKGLIALPDVDDTVLVELTDGTFAQGVVLGGLFGTHGLPDGGPQGGSVPRYVFVTAGGQRLSLDDAAGTMRIENHDGSYLELAPHHALLHAAAPLRIEAPGQAVVIAGSTIDFQRA